MSQCQCTNVSQETTDYRLFFFLIKNICHSVIVPMLGNYRLFKIIFLNKQKITSKQKSNFINSKTVKMLV